MILGRSNSPEKRDHRTVERTAWTRSESTRRGREGERPGYCCWTERQRLGISSPLDVRWLALRRAPTRQGKRIGCLAPTGLHLWCRSRWKFLRAHRGLLNRGDFSIRAEADQHLETSLGMVQRVRKKEKEKWKVLDLQISSKIYGQKFCNLFNLAQARTFKI